MRLRIPSPGIVATSFAALIFAAWASVGGAHGMAAHGTRGVADAAATAADRMAETADATAATEALSGTVHELIVDDMTRGTSERYVELELADGTLVELKGAAVQALSEGSAVEVRGHRDGKGLRVDGARTLAAAAAASAPKASTEVDGTLAILHADYFEAGRGEFIYEVHGAQGRVHELRIAASPPALEPGMHVRVRGWASADGASMTPDRITIVARPAAAAETTTKAATANRVLVIMANFNNTATPGFSAAQVQQVMTSNSDSVANFFRETSYGQQLMNVTTTPAWVTIAMAAPASCGSTDWRNIGTNAEAAAKALGAAYDPDTYNFVVYVFPGVSSCGWSGLAYVNNPHKAWINGTGAFKTATIAHEMGHNFGLLHAASLRCPTEIGGACSSSEYGDPFSAMGNKGSMHYNAMQKAKLAWIPSTSVKTHSGGSATYTLSPLEVGGATTYAVKIPVAANRTYWLEFRQPIGFDVGLAGAANGAQLRVAYPFETLCSGCDSFNDDTELLDMTPSTSSFSDATLPVGQTFSDPTYKINVTVVSANSSALTVSVGSGGAPPPPAPSPTTTSVGSTPNPATVGVAVAITASVSGSAPTGTIAFSDNGVAIGACGAVGLAGSGNVRTAACTTSALAAGSHAIVARYSGDAANSVSTSATLTQTVDASANSGSVNVALQANGGVASASSTLRPANAPVYVNDNQRSGAGWSTGGGGWADGTSGTFPDWVQVTFNGTKTIDHVVVYSVQDNFQAPVEPADALTFSRYGVTAFDVQGWNGSAWVTLGSVTGNSLVKRTLTFAAFTTDRIRVVVNGAADGAWSRITEVEAWTAASAGTYANFALTANGGVATASSTLRVVNAVTCVNDGQRSGAGWSTGGGGWADGTSGVFPDWVQIVFDATRTIDHVAVYSVQDNYSSPIEPTDTMTFTRYGVTAFDVQAWTGSAWVTLGSVTGNSLVKRTVTFAAFTTDRVRIVVNGAADGAWSRVTEIEAWGN